MKIIGNHFDAGEAVLIIGTPLACLVSVFAIHADIRSAENFQKEQRSEFECIARSVAREEMDSRIVAMNGTTDDGLAIKQSEAAATGAPPAPSC